MYTFWQYLSLCNMEIQSELSRKINKISFVWTDFNVLEMFWTQRLSLFRYSQVFCSFATYLVRFLFVLVLLPCVFMSVDLGGLFSLSPYFYYPKFYSSNTLLMKLTDSLNLPMLLYSSDSYYEGVILYCNSLSIPTICPNSELVAPGGRTLSFLCVHFQYFLQLYNSLLINSH